MFTSLTEGTGRQEGGRPLAYRGRSGFIDCCLRRSYGYVTMVFVFVAGMSHSSYKSKILCGVNPISISRVPNRTLSSSQAMRATCRCTCADADGAVVAEVFHRGRVDVGATCGQWAGGGVWGEQGQSGALNFTTLAEGTGRSEGGRNGGGAARDRANRESRIGRLSDGVSQMNEAARQYFAAGPLRRLLLCGVARP